MMRNMRNMKNAIICILFVVCLALLSVKCKKLTTEVSFDITNTSTKDYSEVKIYTTNSEEYFDSLTFQLKVDENKKLLWKDFSSKGEGSFLIKTNDSKSRVFGYYSGSYISNLNNYIEIREDTIIVSN
jgi:hypothetical protein